jgi:hypothetical protein
MQQCLVDAKGEHNLPAGRVHDGWVSGWLSGVTHILPNTGMLVFLISCSSATMLPLQDED